MSEQKQNVELQKFKEVDAIIETFRKEASALTINGVTDKAGYAAVHQVRMKIRAKRIEVDKLRKQMGEEARMRLNAINTEGNRVVKALEEIEEPLEKMQREIDAEKERIKQEAKQRELVRIQQRVNRLFNLGMAYDGNKYHLGTVAISDNQVQTMPDDAFDAVCIDAHSEAERLENERIAEEKRKEAERLELERQRAEQDAERKRLEQIRLDQEAKERQLKEEADRLERERKAEEEKRLKAIEEAENERKRLEREKLEAEERERKRIEELNKAREEAAQKERERIVREQLEKEQAERIEEENRQRAIALAPDKDKLSLFVQSLRQQSYPVVGDPKAARIVEAARKMIEDTATFVTKATEEL